MFSFDNFDFTFQLTLLENVPPPLGHSVPIGNYHLFSSHSHSLKLLFLRESAFIPGISIKCHTQRCQPEMSSSRNYLWRRRETEIKLHHLTKWERDKMYNRTCGSLILYKKSNFLFFFFIFGGVIMLGLLYTCQVM